MFRIIIWAISVTSLYGFMLLTAPRNFVPDYVFEGSSVSNLHTLGQASWQAAQGEIVATSRDSAGGWLVLDRSYQDVEFNASFRCSAGCNAGVLLRAEKTNDGGWKGVYVSLSEGDMGSYDLAIGPDGKEVSRKKLDRSTAQFTRISAGPSISGSSKVPGFAEPAPTPEEQKAQASKPAAPAGPPPGVGRGVRPPQPEIHSNDWNTLDVIVDMDMVWVTLNGRRGGNSATNDRMMGYGPIVLARGRRGEVRFRDVAART